MPTTSKRPSTTSNPRNVTRFGRVIIFGDQLSTSKARPPGERSARHLLPAWFDRSMQFLLAGIAAGRPPPTHAPQAFWASPHPITAIGEPSGLMKVSSNARHDQTYFSVASEF